MSVNTPFYKKIFKKKNKLDGESLDFFKSIDTDTIKKFNSDFSIEQIKQLLSQKKYQGEIYKTDILKSCNEFLRIYSTFTKLQKEQDDLCEYIGKTKITLKVINDMTEKLEILIGSVMINEKEKDDKKLFQKSYLDVENNYGIIVDKLSENIKETKNLLNILGANISNLCYKLLLHFLGQLHMDILIKFKDGEKIYVNTKYYSDGFIEHCFQCLGFYLDKGTAVKVKKGITPRYSWGSVTPESIGYIKERSSDGEFIVDFPECCSWHAGKDELEILNIS